MTIAGFAWLFALPVREPWTSMYPGISMLTLAVLAAMVGMALRRRASLPSVPRTLVLAGMSFAGLSALILACYAAILLDG
jgi:hypothetical protein